MSRIRADKLVNRAGSGGPQFPYGVAGGLNVAGVVTATSFSGDGSSLTGIDATALKDSGGNVKVQANTDGIVVSGIATATTFVGNLTGNATGLSGTPNLNVGIVTATSFSGNGSGLTGLNIPAASDWRDNSLF